MQWVSRTKKTLKINYLISKFNSEKFRVSDSILLIYYQLNQVVISIFMIPPKKPCGTFAQASCWFGLKIQYLIQCTFNKLDQSAFTAVYGHNRITTKSPGNYADSFPW